VIFIEGVRVIMLENWHFDIFWPAHWFHAWNLWLSGWVIDTPKEWAFVLIIFAFIPLWLTGWIALSLVPFEQLICKMVMFPINLVRNMFNPIKIATAKTPVIVKKKSYKEIRPNRIRTPIYDYNDNTSAPSAAALPTPKKPSEAVAALTASNQTLKEKASAARETFSHSLFNLDDEDDDFDLDFDSFEKSDIFKIDSSAKRNKPSAEKTFDDEEDSSPRRRDKRSDYRHDDDDEPMSRSSYNDYDDDRQDDNRRKRFDRKDNNQDSRRGNKSRYEESSPRRERDNRERDNRDNRDRENRDNRDRASSRQTNKPSRANADTVSHSNNPVADVILQKGYDILTNISVKNTIIDFIAVTKDKICLCYIDKEPGDWLADEERFNNEEPLWFSESSHRISPVRKLDLARQALTAKLDESDFDLEIKPYLIIQTGNIINAEDMFEVWDDIGVEVTRINRGSPKEIRLFSKTLQEADDRMEKSTLDSLKKLIKNIS